MIGQRRDHKSLVFLDESFVTCFIPMGYNFIAQARSGTRRAETTITICYNEVYGKNAPKITCTDCAFLITWGVGEWRGRLLGVRRPPRQSACFLIWRCTRE